PGVRVEANPLQLAHYGIGLEALRAAIGTVNVNQPKGYLQVDERRWSINATDQRFGAAAYAPLIVATDRGPVRAAPERWGLTASVASALTNVPTVNAGSGSSAQPGVAGGGSTATPNAGAGSGHGIVRIRNVAKVVDSVENVQAAGVFNGKPAIVVLVFKTSTA